jgi:hypothetical protein
LSYIGPDLTNPTLPTCQLSSASFHLKPYCCRPKPLIVGNQEQAQEDEQFVSNHLYEALSRYKPKQLSISDIEQGCSIYSSDIEQDVRSYKGANYERQNRGAHPAHRKEAWH